MNSLTFALLLSFVMVTSAIVCLPNICTVAKCKKIENCDGELRQNGTFCGCCPACIKLLGKNESCFITSGVPVSAECQPPLLCRNGVCSE